MKRQPIPCTIEKDGEVHTFESIRKCSEFLGCQTGQVTMAKSMTYKGWKVTLHGERHKIRELKCKVYLFHKTGEFIREFDSVHEAGRYFGLKYPRAILYSLKTGKYKQYLIRYQKDNPDTYDLNDFN